MDFIHLARKNRERGRIDAYAEVKKILHGWNGKNTDDILNAIRELVWEEAEKIECEMCSAFMYPEEAKEGCIANGPDDYDKVPVCSDCFERFMARAE